MAIGKVTTKGLNETIAHLEKLGDTEDTLKSAMYEGAKVTADIGRQEIQTLKTSTKGGTDKSMRWAYPSDVKALLDGWGIAPFRVDDFNPETKIGFDGYTTTKSGKKVAIPVIANSINAGTSFMQKQPFISKIKRRANSQAVNAMQESLNKSISKFQ